MNLVERAKNILLSPKTEWEVIKNETLSTVDMFTKYAMILAAIPAVAGLIGYSLIGQSFMGVTVKWPFGNAVIWAILIYVFSLAGAYLLAFIVDTLAPSFGAQKDMNASLKAVIFAYTATWVGGILNLFPPIAILGALLGLYSLFLLWMGMKTLKNPPADKMAGYFIVTLVVAVIIFWLIGWIVMRIAVGSVYNF